MKDINLKPGTFSEPLENASGKGPGKSLVKFILGVLSSNSVCCDKTFAHGTVNNSTIVLKSYANAAALPTTGVAEGTLAYDTGANKVNVFTGSTWVALH